MECLKNYNEKSVLNEEFYTTVSNVKVAHFHGFTLCLEANKEKDSSLSFFLPPSLFPQLASLTCHILFQDDPSFFRSETVYQKRLRSCSTISSYESFHSYSYPKCSLQANSCSFARPQVIHHLIIFLFFYNPRYGSYKKQVSHSFWMAPILNMVSNIYCYCVCRY